MADEWRELDDDDLEEIVMKSGLTLGEAQRRARGEAGSPEEQEQARAELEELNDKFRGIVDGLAQLPAMKALTARVRRQANELFAGRTSLDPFPRPEQFVPTTMLEHQIVDSPAARSSRLLEELVEYQKAQADFNDGMRKQAELARVEANREAKSARRREWTTIVLAFLALVATVIGIILAR